MSDNPSSCCPITMACFRKAAVPWGVQRTAFRGRRIPVERKIGQLFERHAPQGRMGERVVAVIVHALKP